MCVYDCVVYHSDCCVVSVCLLYVVVSYLFWLIFSQARIEPIPTSVAGYYIRIVNSNVVQVWKRETRRKKDSMAAF